MLKIIKESNDREVLKEIKIGRKNDDHCTIITVYDREIEVEDMIFGIVNVTLVASFGSFSSRSFDTLQEAKDYSKDWLGENTIDYERESNTVFTNAVGERLSYNGFKVII